MNNENNDEICRKSAGSRSMEVQEEAVAYSADSESQPDAENDQLLDLYNMTKELEKEAGNPLKRRLWTQRAEEVLREYPFDSVHGYVSLVARAEILYNLERFDAVINLIDAEATPLTVLPDGIEIGIHEYGKNGTSTPRIIAIKSLALGQTGKLHEAVRQMRKAYELRLCWSREDEQFDRYKRGLGIETIFFVMEDVLENNMIWQGGVVFETATFNERLLHMYAYSLTEKPPMYLTYTGSGDCSVLSSAYREKLVSTHVFMAEKCKQLLAENHDHYLAIYCMARILHMSGDGYEYNGDDLKYFDKSIQYYEKALSNYNRSIELNPDFSEAYFQRAKVFEKQDLFTNALQDYDTAIQQDKEFAEAYFRRGNLKLQLQQFESACGDFDETKRLNLALEKKISFDELEQSIFKSQGALEQRHQEERSKVMRDLSHTLKNLTASVISPLKDYSQNEPLCSGKMQRSIRGVELIQETVNALSISFRGEPEDFVKDAHDGLRSKSTYSLLDILIAAIQSAAGCMFDSAYYNAFCHRYFKTREAFGRAKNDWNSLGQPPSPLELKAFFEQHMTQFVIRDESGLAQMQLGDAYNSPMKLTVLFKELLLIAFKHACYSPRSQRFVRIESEQSDEFIEIKITNVIEGKFDRFTRPGMEIVNNIVHQAGGNLVVESVGNTHSATFTMPNIFIDQEINKTRKGNKS